MSKKVYRNMTIKSVPDVTDIIIIGGGTAGLVLANRLSEDRNVQIIVLESGRDVTQDPTVQDPSAYVSLLGPETAWQLDTTPQVGEIEQCRLLLSKTHS